MTTGRFTEREFSRRRTRLTKHYATLTERILAGVVHQSVAELERNPDDPVTWDMHAPMVEVARAELAARRTNRPLVSIAALMRGEVPLEAI